MIDRRALVVGISLPVVATHAVWAQGPGDLPRLALVDPALPIESIAEGGDAK
jgi:hypothetical protein